MNQSSSKQPVVLAVCDSPGGIPKLPRGEVEITIDGIRGDAHDHDKHVRPARALSLFDEEIMLQLCTEGYDLIPGTVGENITFRGVDVQGMEPGTILEMGEVAIRLEEPRRPCFVLDTIDPQLKEDIVGRCGYMASVVKTGRLKPGTAVVRRLDE